MSVIEDIFGEIFREILSSVAVRTTRFVMRLVSFGFIRVQGFLDSPYPDEPEFGWHNVIWRWDGKYLWLSNPFALYFGIFLWIAVLSALVYYWHAFS